jgi:hypothetical protein
MEHKATSLKEGETLPKKLQSKKHSEEGCSKRDKKLATAFVFGENSRSLSLARFKKKLLATQDAREGWMLA